MRSESPVEIVARINASIESELTRLTSAVGEEAQEQRRRLEGMRTDAARLLATAEMEEEQKRLALRLIEKSLSSLLTPKVAVSGRDAHDDAEDEDEDEDEDENEKSISRARDLGYRDGGQLMRAHDLMEMKKYNLMVGALCIIGAAVGLLVVLKVILPALTAVLSTLAVAGVGTGLAIGLAFLAVYGLRLCYRRISGDGLSAGAKPVGQKRDESALADPLASTIRPGITSGASGGLRPEPPIPAALSATSGDGASSPRAGTGAGAAAGATAPDPGSSGGLSTSGSRPSGSRPSGHGQAHEPSSTVAPPVGGGHHHG